MQQAAQQNSSFCDYNYNAIALSVPISMNTSRSPGDKNIGQNTINILDNKNQVNTRYDTKKKSKLINLVENEEIPSASNTIIPLQQARLTGFDNFIISEENGMKEPTINTGKNSIDTRSPAYGRYNNEDTAEETADLGTRIKNKQALYLFKQSSPYTSVSKPVTNSLKMRNTAHT